MALGSSDLWPRIFGFLRRPTPVSDQFRAFMEIDNKTLTPALRKDIKEDIGKQFQNWQVTIVPKDEDQNLPLLEQETPIIRIRIRIRIEQSFGVETYFRSTLARFIHGSRVCPQIWRIEGCHGYM